MGSKGKKKTTMAKLNREQKLRERKHEKAMRKDARKRAAAEEAAAPSEEIVTDPSEDFVPEQAEVVRV